jgi:hypothetical protein
MPSGSIRKVWFIAMLVVVFVVWPRTAAGFTPPPEDDAPPVPTPAQARARLSEGFRQILSYFERHELSLLAAWREMRSSGDPDYFERNHPGISRELDAWASSLERQFGVEAEATRRLDFTFLLEEFAPVVMDEQRSSLSRDNAMATIAMVCLMDTLRCEPGLLHRFLFVVVTEDPSALRKTEALRCWRRSGGDIDEGIVEQVLSTPAAADVELRSEAAKILFSRDTGASLQAQRRLLDTHGVVGGDAGEPERIACEAMRRMAEARYEPAAPDLIRALDDAAPAVRVCAAEALGRITGQSPAFGPDPSSGPSEGTREAWRSWWRARSTRGSAGR